mgnify:CR=1 FL=1
MTGAGRRQAPQSCEATVLRFPDFLCVGFQKCGTTWLHSNLSAHPQVWLPQCKEINYFAHIYLPEHRNWIDRQRVNQMSSVLGGIDMTAPRAMAALREWLHQCDPVYNDGWYGHVFSPVRTDMLCGDISPAYAGLPPAGLVHVRRLSPHARILMMVRDPVQRIVSHVGHVLKHWETSGLKDVPRPDVKQILDNPSVWIWSDFAAAHSAWSEAFPGAVSVYDHERVATDAAALLAEICHDLGIDENIAFHEAEERVFAGAPYEGADRVRALVKKRLRPAMERFAALFPEIGEKWLEEHYAGAGGRRRGPGGLMKALSRHRGAS